MTRPSRVWRPPNPPTHYLLLTIHSALLVLFAGCATPYQATGFEGGFTEVAMADDVFEIGFNGNTRVDAKALEQSLLRRAAEAARAHGFTHFVVEDRGWQTGLGFVFRPGILGPSRHIERTMRIRCYTGDPGLPDAYDAEGRLHPAPADQHTHPVDTL